MAPFFLFKSGRNGRLPWLVYYGRGRLPACLPGGPAGPRAGPGPGGAGRLPADPVADHVGGITAMIASRHPVIAGKFRNPILDFVFNQEILARKQFGLGETAKWILENRFNREKSGAKQFGLVTKDTLWPKPVLP